MHHREVAAIAAEVIKNPPPIVRAAKRFLAAIGGEHEGHEGMAAAELLARVVNGDGAEQAAAPAVDEGGRPVAK